MVALADDLVQPSAGIRGGIDGGGGKEEQGNGYQHTGWILEEPVKTVEREMGKPKPAGR